MTTRIRTSIASAAAFASVGALVITTPAIGAQLELTTASTAAINSLATPFELLSKSKWEGSQGVFSSDDSDDDDDHYGNGHSDDDDDDDDGGIGNIGNFVADFLAANQAQVLAVTAMIPVFYLGPVAVGNSLLATAFYDGYNGSAPGLEGVVSYVTSQFGVPPTDIVEGLVLGLTSLVPQFNIGPVAVGNSLLATAYFDGYNGSGTGLPGVISYVTSQLGLQAPAPAAVTVTAAAAAVAANETAPAAESAPVQVSVSRVALAAPAAAQDRDESTTTVDAVEVGTSAGENADTATESRPTGGRGSASAKAGSAHAKARSERSAKAASSDD